VGEHDGIHHFTIGQNCKIAGLRHPYFVVSKINQEDILVVNISIEIKQSIYIKRKLFSGSRNAPSGPLL